MGGNWDFNDEENKFHVHFKEDKPITLVTMSSGGKFLFTANGSNIVTQ